ncbi:hypothetical protein HDU86_007285 [Geranomyces michiganensis]|nr:hypothetical protein HDU86_007285 [Geranomyces michiganensis]
MSTPAGHEEWVRHPSGKYHISKSSPWCYSDADGYFYFDAFGRIVKQGQQELPPPTGAAVGAAPSKTAADAAISAALALAATTNIEDGEISDSDRIHHRRDDRRRRGDYIHENDDRRWPRNRNDPHHGHDDFSSTPGGGVGVWQDAAVAQSAAEGAAPESDATMKLVVVESKLLDVGSLVLVDAAGITVGRDMSFERRLVLKELTVSRTHCTVFVDRVMETIKEEGGKKADLSVGGQNGAESTAERVNVETGPASASTQTVAFADALERAKAVAARLMDEKNSSSTTQTSSDNMSSGAKRLYSERANSNSPQSRRHSLSPRPQHTRRRAVDCFFVADAGSTYGTFVNEMRLSKPKASSQPHRIHHGDVITIGSTKLAAHIHPEWPCDGCRVSSSSNIVSTEARGKSDPASAANSINSAAGAVTSDKKSSKGKTALEAERMQELRRLRREALGVPAPSGASTAAMGEGGNDVDIREEGGGDNDTHTQERRSRGKRQKRGEALAAGYVDRAAMRRQMHGLDVSIVPDSRLVGGGRGGGSGGFRGGYNHHGLRKNDSGNYNHRSYNQHNQHQHQEANTIDTALTHTEPSNVGSRMLQKMGWTAGQGLGAAGDGRVEPVAVSQRMGRVGLGVQGADGGGFSKPGGRRETLKEATVRRARERFSAMQRGEED